MDKYNDDKVYSDQEFTLKQLDNLKQDLSNMASAIVRKLEDVDQVICGLTKGHNWRLHRFDDKIYPCADPPGVYVYKCIDCGETIFIPAHEKKIIKRFKRTTKGT